MSLHPRHRSEQGFTLLEVLLATVLVAVIGAMVFGSLQFSAGAIDKARTVAAREQIVRSTLRIMAEELGTSFSSPVGPWIGVNAQQEGRPADTVAFLTMGQFRGAESGPQTEYVRIVYAREGDRLLRFVRRNLYGINDDSIDRLELVSNVKEFNVRYYDALATVWTDEWDGRARSAPPGAILIELTLGQDNTEDSTVREWIRVGLQS